SMAAALKTLAQLGRDENRRTIAVLGEMAELGPYAQEEHDRIGRLAVRLDIRQLVVVGDGARHIHAAAGLEGSWDGESKFVPDIEAAYDGLRDEVRPGDIVLVKSSKSAGLRFLGGRLAGGEDQPWSPCSWRAPSRSSSRSLRRRSGSGCSSVWAGASSSATTGRSRTTPSAARPRWAASCSSSGRCSATSSGISWRRSRPHASRRS